jgi:hypothetical protein
MKRVCACSVAFLAATLLWVPSAAAQDQDGWQFRVTPYLWAMSTAGHGQLGPVPVSLDADTLTIVKGLDFSLESYVEAAKHGWVLLADTHISKVHVDIPATTQNGVPFADGRFTNRQVIIAAAAGRRMMTRYGLLDMYGGIRYYNIDLEATFSGFPFLFGQKDAWVDPIVGGRIVMPLKPKLAFALRGDIGGFHAGSKLAWMIQPTVTYQIRPKISALIGYRMLKVNRESGLGPTPFNENLFNYDVNHRGPGMGLTFAF